MHVARRVGLTALALALVFGMGVHYDVAVDRHWPYPDADDLAGEYAAHVGETTLLFGRVEAVDAANDRVELVVEHGDGVFTMTVYGVAAAVEPGGIVQVVGTLEPGRALTADRVVVVTRSAGAEWRKVGLSGVGAVVVLAAFFRQWRLTGDALVFEGR